MLVGKGSILAICVRCYYKGNNTNLQVVSMEMLCNCIKIDLKFW